MEFARINSEFAQLFPDAYQWLLSQSLSNELAILESRAVACDLNDWQERRLFELRQSAERNRRLKAGNLEMRLVFLAE